MPSVIDVLSTLEAMKGKDSRTYIDALRLQQAILAIEWMFYTGARPSEVALARLRDIDWKRATWTVRDCEGAKTGSREVPLHEGLVRSVREYVASLSEDTTETLWPPLIDRESLTRIWGGHARRGALAAGVELWNQKGLRHLAVTRMLSSGIDVATAASITGHSPVVLLKTYAHVLNDRRKAAVDVLAPPTGQVIPQHKPG